jgi:hypothetical protein
MKIIILLVGLAVVAALSIANDHYVKKHGGETEYITEKLCKK